MKMVLKGAKVSIESAIPSNFEIIRSVPHGHVAAILETISRLGLSKIINSRSSRQKNLVIAMIIARIINPKSKLATARGFNYQTCSHSLGQLLNIVFGLLCDKDGCPCAVEVFSGNTADSSTLASQIDKVRNRFGIPHVIWVTDRGILTSAKINELVKPVEGLDYISGLTKPQIRNLAEVEAIQLGLFDELNLVEFESEDYPGERLIACRNPLIAEKNSLQREGILQVVEKELEKIVKATKRERRPLFGQDKIALRVAKVLNKYKANKYYTLDIKESEFSYQLREELIAQETALDGIYVIRTSVEETVMDAPTTVKAYKSLSQVESAFRCYKSIDLKVRPIYHYKGERVKAHIFLCMLAYYVEWHLREFLAPLLFEDEEVSDLTTDVIRASRSKSAIAKDRKKRNSEGLPVHSFRTLLEDLGTICLNKIRYTNSTGEYVFSKITQPTPLQQSCLDLLGVSLICTQ